MYSGRLLGAVGLGCLGIGTLFGTQVKVQWTDSVTNSPTVENLTTKCILNDVKNKIFPILQASSAIIPRNDNVSGNVPSSSSNLSDIMRFGLPSYDNLRTYNDFVLSYDRRNRTAYWVFEHLTADKVQKTPNVSRDDTKFVEDLNVHAFFRSTNADYKGSGYDRGHLAAAGNHRWSQLALDETFHLTNISPQVGKGFNRDAWNMLENLMRHFTKEFKNVYVCTGPLYLPKMEPDGKMYVKYEVIGKSHVSVPTHFFKVAVCESAYGTLDLFSFVMPNQALPIDKNMDLKKFCVPLDSIERAAGFLIFEKIPKNKFRKINGRDV